MLYCTTVESGGWKITLITLLGSGGQNIFYKIFTGQDTCTYLQNSQATLRNRWSFPTCILTCCHRIQTADLCNKTIAVTFQFKVVSDKSDPTVFVHCSINMVLWEN